MRTRMPEIPSQAPILNPLHTFCSKMIQKKTSLLSLGWKQQIRRLISESGTTDSTVGVSNSWILTETLETPPPFPYKCFFLFTLTLIKNYLKKGRSVQVIAEMIFWIHISIFFLKTHLFFFAFTRPWFSRRKKISPLPFKLMNYKCAQLPPCNLCLFWLTSSHVSQSHTQVSLLSFISRTHEWRGEGGGCFVRENILIWTLIWMLDSWLK